MRSTILFFILVFGLQMTYAQVETKFSPGGSIITQVKHIKEHPKATKIKQLPTFDVQKLINEDELYKGLDAPFRFGKGFDTDIVLADGEWTDVDGGRLWSMEFMSEGAYSINFVFNNFFLPDSAKLYVTNEEGTMLYGPVTSENNTKNGYFLTDLVQGDVVTIYLFEPDAEKGKSQLTIKRVVHAYKNLFSNLAYGNLGASGSCNINIACYPDWDEESDAVALVLLSNGDELCSGSLIMTTDQSFDPYFLSAFHCVDDNGSGVLSSSEISDAENWMFKFQYKMNSCNGSSATTGITYNGATYRAAWNTSDFVLMEMDESPVGNSQFSWLGWDRSGDDPENGTGIHHPSGDVMKISFDNDDIPETSEGSTSGGTSHWYVDIDDGTLEQGSSGSPLFNEDERVVGQLHSGYPGCNSSKQFWYGCFHYSWTGGGTNTTRLSNWLDPCGTGAVTTNTSRSPYISGSSIVCPSGAAFTVNNLPPGTTITWDQNSYLTRVSPQGSNPCTFAAAGQGSGWIEASITTGCGTIDLPRKEVNADPGITGEYAQGTTWKTLYTVNFISREETTVVSVESEGSSSPFNWQLLPEGSVVNWGSYNTSNSIIGFNIISGSQASFSVSTTNACGSTVNGYYYFVVSGGYSLSLSPNPSSGETTLTIEGTPEGGGDEEWIMEVYTSTQVLKEKKTRLKGKEYKLNTSGWKKGIYIVNVKYGDEILTARLVVGE